MMPQVIDTNVLMVADGQHRQAGADCEVACIAYLRGVRSGGAVLVDEAHRILSEYLDNLRHGGQPSTGWAFYKWLHDHLGDRRCRLVQITPIPGPAEDYKEFPRRADLRGFDARDRKFVAVALASRADPEIGNATDPDWAEYHSALCDCGVRVRFLCPHVCGVRD